jgi:predicted acylesterase/phospholipase RssA
MFTSVKYKSKVYVDGAIVDPLPVPPEARDVLAIGFERERVGTLDTMGDFIGALRAANRPSTNLSGRHIMKLRCPDIDEFDLVLPPDVLKACFASGRKQASAWIKKNV